jgi:hypothetical protein
VTFPLSGDVIPLSQCRIIDAMLGQGLTPPAQIRSLFQSFDCNPCQPVADIKMRARFVERQSRTPIFS